ncbi:MAG TPA: ribosome recycling factor [Bacteroidetes bacterium]|nr:ribosome-recycling factor [bacterium BMS3Bbin04]HDO65858.1 ribosome recycling factor [Bacteroidota bacterium]HEX04983.1 ribosome recycling factor [Bacteroidota bacterium]
MDKDEILLDADDRMGKCVRFLQDTYARIRSGKASVGLLDGIIVNAYGTDVPLNQVSNLLTPDVKTIAIQPYDKNLIPGIEKAILTSNLDLNPVNDGTIVRINIPSLTEERRKDIVKVIHKNAEEARQAVRQVRRDGNDNTKKLEKASEISEDNMHDMLKEIQDLTDSHIKDIDRVVGDKEKEIIEI